MLLSKENDRVFSYAITVNDDIDICDNREVLWAMATRADFEKDLIHLKDVPIAALDPCGRDVGATRIGTRLGIDAIKPALEQYPEEIGLLKCGKKRVRLDDYVNKGKLSAVRHFMQA